MVKKEPKIYYKVIGRTDRCSALILSNQVKVHYLVGKWVKPKLEGSKLMVFDNEYNAVKWARSWNRNSYYNLMVVKCYVKYPVKRYLFKVEDIFDCYVKRTFIKFWKKWKNLRRSKLRSTSISISGNIPDGTVYVSQVKCLE